jgi:tRNA U34 5-methylaminomethyl-2-thiouridine-forming methyltransferase MnmC
MLKSSTFDNMKREIRITNDGSPTLYIPELDEHYHSTHGAVQEAKHVFIENGLNLLSEKSELSILEVGFGCGLNALLTCFETQNKPSTFIKYYGIEAYPLGIEENKKLDFSEQIIVSNYSELYVNIIEANWNDLVQITSNFQLHKIQSKLQEFDFSSYSFDLIYYDAFGPRAQGEMWEKSIFEPLYEVLSPNGMLVTYCAQGQFKRNLKEIGFNVEARPGPPGKREMTLAKKL